MKNWTLRKKALAIIATVGVSGCKSITIDNPLDITCPGGAVTAANVSFTVHSMSMRVGEAIILIAFPTDAKGNYAKCATVTWSTSNASVANVDGGVHAVAVGTAYIKATSGTAADSVLVTVTAQ